MKIAIWSLFAVLALGWTGTVALMAALTGWAAGTVASGDMGDLARTVAQWPVPEWVSVWIDPGWVRALQEAVLWGLQTFGAVLPHAGQAMGWLVPLMWGIWGLGLLFLLVLAAAGHWMSGRSWTPRTLAARSW